MACEDGPDDCVEPKAQFRAAGWIRQNFYAVAQFGEADAADEKRVLRLIFDESGNPMIWLRLAQFRGDVGV